VRFTTYYNHYNGLFNNLNDALEFEQTVLQAGSEFLPECAKAVLDGKRPTASYWQFLISQIEG